MKNFHGTDKKSSFFEGWYLKHQTDDLSLAFIPAFHIDRKGHANASLQIISRNDSWTIPFSHKDFHAAADRFSVKLGNNSFSSKGISLDISTPDLYVKGKLAYGPFTSLSSDIMGPFRFFPFMQCSHGVISLTHALTGSLNFNGWVMDFNGGIGYIEKDWGQSFPSSYLWTQCSWSCKADQTPCSIMLSIADIPFMGFHFTGCIGVVYYKGREYRLATYRGAKVLEHTDREAVIRQGDYLLHVNLLKGNSHPLQAPESGNMNRTIHESLCSHVLYQLFYRHKKICDVLSSHAGFETG